MSDRVYAPQWRLSSWPPGDWRVEVQGEDGEVEIDGEDFGWMSPGDLNNDLWGDVSQALTNLGFAADQEDEDGELVYSAEARAAAPWLAWERAPWHLKAAILARREKALMARVEGLEEQIAGYQCQNRWWAEPGDPDYGWCAAHARKYCMDTASGLVCQVCRAEKAEEESRAGRPCSEKVETCRVVFVGPAPIGLVGRICTEFGKKFPGSVALDAGHAVSRGYGATLTLVEARDVGLGKGDYRAPEGGWTVDAGGEDMNWCNDCHRRVADYKDSGLCSRCEVCKLRGEVAGLEAELDAERAEAARLREKLNDACADVVQLRAINERLQSRCERREGDPSVEQVRLLADPAWVDPARPISEAMVATAKVVLRVWGEETSSGRSGPPPSKGD